MSRFRKRIAAAALVVVASSIGLWWTAASGAAAPVAEADAAAAPRRSFELVVTPQIEPSRSSASAPKAVGAANAAGVSPRFDAADFSVSLGDTAVAVSEVRPIAPGDWHVLVYVDGLSAKHDEIERAAAALSGASAQLAALGPVTILVADTLVEPWVEDSKDVEKIQGSFAELHDAEFEEPKARGADFAATRRGLLLDQLGRRSFGQGARLLVMVGDVNAERSSGGGGGGGASGRGGGGGGGSGGRGGTGAAGAGAASADAADAPARRGELATAVASLGWVTLPLHLGAGGVAVSPLAEETGGESVADGAALAGALGRFASSALLRIDVPLEVARAAAAHTALPAVNGARLGGGAGGGDAQTAIATLSVSTTRPEFTLRAQRWLATSTPDFVLRARVNALLADEAEGTLDLSASATLDSDVSGEPVLAVEVLTDPPSGGRAGARRWTGRSSRLRASFVLARVDDEPIVMHHPGSGAVLDGAGGWLLQARLDAPQDLEGVAVMVEDVTTGDWGAALAEIDGEGIEVPSSVRVASEVADLRVKSSAPAVASAAGAAGGKPAESPLVRLVPPRAHDLTGEQTFRAMSLNAFIERVVFLLDDKQVAEDHSDPYTAHIDLGPELRQREVKAIAYDRAGRELGHDSVVVNRPRTAFGVHIVEVSGAAPTAGNGTLGRGPASAGAPPAGPPVEVTADVAVPPRQHVGRVEFYWNETLAATLAAAPWKASLGPRPNTGGDFVRVVAYLDDGSSLEDVQLVGASGSIERVEVNLVEIFTVVLDSAGSPVRDLKRDEVSVRIAGKPVELERFGVAEDLPLDVGLVIDTSQSMEVLMDDTRQAAVRFLADLIRPGDRAFLVDFDTKPRLAQPMTKDMKDVMKALGSLRAGGNTALYDSIVFSTLHFEEGEERRALVLLTDGDDYKSKFSDRQAYLQARSAGTPVYILSLAGMDWLRPSLKKDDLELIAKQTGGHVFYVSAAPELDTAYARIGAELRSQYVLAFATPKPLSDEELGKLDVRVSRPNTTVRAVVSGRSVKAH